MISPGVVMIRVKSGNWKEKYLYLQFGMKMYFILYEWLYGWLYTLCNVNDLPGELSQCVMLTLIL